MPNRRRGEVEAILDGRPMTLVLTLGALAELEAAFAAEDLSALAARFAAGRLSARDVIRVVTCGLRGAGHAVGEPEVAALRIDGGVVGWAALVADLLAVTFGAEEGAGRPDTAANDRPQTGSAPPSSVLHGTSEDETFSRRELDPVPSPPIVPGAPSPSPGTI